MLNHETISADWATAKRAMDAFLKTDSTSAFNQLKDLYVQNKSELFPYFPEDGRISLEVKTCDDQGDFHRSYRTVVASLAEILRKISNTPKYDTIFVSSSQHARFVNFITAIKDIFYPDEIKTNKTIYERIDPIRREKMMPVGTKLTKYIASAIKSYSITQEWGTLSNLFSCAGDLLWYTPITDENLVLMADAVTEAFSHVVNAMKNSDNTKVVLSINPLDILMSSAGTTSWTSCHNIFSGCFKTGPVSYMVDSSSVIAYAYSRRSDYLDGAVEINDVPVKKWRQMVYLDLSTGTAAFSKEYPNNKPNFTRTIEEITTEVIAEALGVKVSAIMRTIDYPCMQRTSDYNYQDPIEETFSYLASLDVKNITIPVGAEYLPCMQCGKKRTDYNTDSHICPDCMPVYCYNCSGITDNHHVIGGGRYCQTCYDSMTRLIPCSDCNGLTESYRLQRMNNLPVGVCQNCFANYTYCDSCGRWHLTDTTTPFRSSAYGSSHYCVDCVARYLMKCTRCNTLFRSGDISVNGNCLPCEDKIRLAAFYEEIYYWDLYDGDFIYYWELYELYWDLLQDLYGARYMYFRHIMIWPEPIREEENAYAV